MLVAFELWNFGSWSVDCGLYTCTGVGFSIIICVYLLFRIYFILNMYVLFLCILRGNKRNGDVFLVGVSSKGDVFNWFYLFSFLDRFQVWSFVEDPHVVSSDRLEAQHQLQNEAGSSSASLRLLSRSRAAFNSVNLVNLGLG